MARLHDRHNAEQVPIGVTIIGQYFENNRRILISGNRKILSDRFTPIHRCLPPHLRHVAATSIPTAAGEGQQKAANDDGAEEAAGPSLPPSPEFAASEHDEAGE
jgi:hypothetical protein